jgi:hypothetical protein
MASMIETISRLVERTARMMNDAALTAADIQYLHVVISNWIVNWIPEPDRRVMAVRELESAIGIRGQIGPSRRRSG